MKMTKSAVLAAFAAALAAAGACRSYTSPYDYVENWLLREDPVLPSVIHCDVIYLAGEPYGGSEDIHDMYAHAAAAVGNGRFGGVARVFAPLVSRPEDLDAAIEWYLDKHHEKGRAFVFIGEGRAGALLRSCEEKRGGWLRARGLCGSFYSDETRMGFVTDEIVQQVRTLSAKARYRRIWGRDPR